MQILMRISIVIVSFFLAGEDGMLSASLGSDSEPVSYCDKASACVFSRPFLSGKSKGFSVRMSLQQPKREDGSKILNSHRRA